MLVKAKKDLNVPMEHKPRDYITDDTVVEVEETAYYLRRIEEGDLVIATAAEAKKQAQAQAN